MNLKAEEKDAIVEITEHPEFRVFLRLMDGLAAEAEQTVIRRGLSIGKETEVIYDLARAEGARRLQRALVSLIESLRGKPKT